MIIAVIPAAGMGTRLAVGIPKLFVELSSDFYVIDLLESTISDLADECCFVIRPDMIREFQSLSKSEKSTFVIQSTPSGMGNAIFCASSKIIEHEYVLVIWGDQVGISKETLRRVIESHRNLGAYCTVPLAKIDYPYVHYILDNSVGLKGILHRREGDSMPSQGLSDIGVFMLNTENLVSYWEDYLETSGKLGSVTNEVNFLPFLVYLAGIGANMNFISVEDAGEALGMNSPDELRKIRQLMSKEGE